MNRVVIASVCLGMLIAGCSGADDNLPSSVPVVAGVSRDDVMSSLTNDAIVPTFDALAASATSLVTAIEVLCLDPSDAASLTATQVAWRETRLAWNLTRAFRFGPPMELRSMSKIDFPADLDKVTDLLAGRDPVDAESVAALGADKRGLGSIEFVLFGADQVTDRACMFVLSAAGLVAGATSDAALGWRAAELGDTKQFIDDSVNGVIFALVDIGDQRLGKASGAVSGIAEYAEVDSGPAHTSLDEIGSVLDSIDLILHGGPDAAGLYDLVAIQSAESVDRLASDLSAARAAVTAIPAPLADASDTVLTTAAYEAVRAPLRTVRTETASLLGVTLTLGDADGDS